jgi:hypothetical protein
MPAIRSPSPARSAGLRTPSTPRLSTRVYNMVVETSRWPSDSCTVRMSAPPSTAPPRPWPAAPPIRADDGGGTHRCPDPRRSAEPERPTAIAASVPPAGTCAPTPPAARPSPLRFHSLAGEGEPSGRRPPDVYLGDVRVVSWLRSRRQVLVGPAYRGPPPGGRRSPVFSLVLITAARREVFGWKNAVGGDAPPLGRRSSQATIRSDMTAAKSQWSAVIAG